MENNYEKILEKLQSKIFNLSQGLKLWLESGKPINKSEIEMEIKKSHEILENIDNILEFIDKYQLD